MSLQSLAEEFIAAFDKTEYQKAAECLPKVKLELAKANLIVPSLDAQQKDLIAARQLLEVGVLVAVHCSNEDEMNRLFSQVRPFYAKSLQLPQSENENRLVALYLLLLVSKNQIAEFHTELETLEKNPEDDKYLCYPIRLERWLMEGSYDKVWRAITQQSELPSPEFAVLAESLIYTVRSEIALCAECAYKSLPVSNARHLLFLKSDQDIVEFVNQQPGWSVKNGRIYFPQRNEQNNDVPAERLIGNNLDYARKIETIV